jgi:Cu+-exporting ATPase
LRGLGLDVVMLTGDQETTAQAVAREVGITRVFAGVLPGTKSERIAELQREGRVVGMVGDGVNDAPALGAGRRWVRPAQRHGRRDRGRGRHPHAQRPAQRGRRHPHLARDPESDPTESLLGLRLQCRRHPLGGRCLLPAFGWLLSPVFAGVAMALSSILVVGNSLRLARLDP